MPAYWLARAHVNDADEYKKYAEQLPALFAQHNARILVRGGAFKVLEGEAPPYERFVVIEFPSMEEGEAFFHSEEYRNAAMFRRAPGVARNEVILVDGGDAGVR